MTRPTQIRILLSVTFAIFLVTIFHFEILRHFSHMKFEAARGLAGSLLVALPLAALMGAALPQRQGSGATLMLSFLHYLFFLPSAVLVAVSSPSREYLVALALSYALVNGLARLRLPSLASGIGGVPRSPGWLYFASLAVLLGTLLLYFWYGGLDVVNFDRKQVYRYRDLVGEIMPALVGYLRSTAANVLIPLALALALQARSIWRVGLIALCAVLLFGVSSHKSTIFTFALVFFSFWATSKEPAANRWGLMLLAIVGLCVMEVLLLGQILGRDQPGVLTSHLVRRGLMVPPLLDSLWVDFFSDKAKYYWSGSRLSMGLIDQPYGQSAPRVIGSEVFGSKVMAANTGLIGSGYANSGLLGVALYSAILGLLIAYLDALGRKVGASLVAVASLGVLPKIVTSTDLTTAFLTHGLLLLLVLLHLLPPSSTSSKTDG